MEREVECGLKIDWSRKQEEGRENKGREGRGNKAVRNRGKVEAGERERGKRGRGKEDFKLFTLYFLIHYSVVFAGFSAESLRARIEDGKKNVDLCCHDLAEYSLVFTM